MLQQEIKFVSVICTTKICKFPSAIEPNAVLKVQSSLCHPNLELLWYKSKVEELKRYPQFPICKNSREPLLQNRRPSTKSTILTLGTGQVSSSFQEIKN